MSSARTTRASAPARPEDERLPVGKSFGYGLQHVLTMYGGIIAPPIIIGNAAGVTPDQIALLIASCLFVGGLATILQTVGIPFFGSQLPLVQGTSFASVATLTAIVTGGGGLPAAFGAVLIASLIGLLITPFFSMVVHLFPPVVNGVVITAIGLSLLPVAGNWIMGNNAKAPDYGSVANLGMAGLTLLIIMLLSKVGSAAISRLSILLGLIIGTVIAAVTGMADFSKVGTGAVVAFPQPFAFGLPTVPVAGTISMVIVVLVIMTETTADILAVGEIAGSRVDARRVGNGLRADMLASTVAPVFNGFTQSAFAQNVGLVAITGVKSRFVVTAGGVILVVLGLVPVVGRIVAAIPYPVLGGAGVVLFGTVAASGIRTLAKVEYRNNLNLVIVAVSLGFGMLPIVRPTIYDKFPDWFATIFDSGISSAAIMAILLNILFNVITAGNTPDASVFAAGPVRMVRDDELEALEEGDYFQGGKLMDKDGNVVEVVTPAVFDEAVKTGAIQRVPRNGNTAH
ncbi:uracil permease [Tersicoccus phoenicis]|uniref:Uracil permease n=1 Tax=Tersicoccus phoenicis TaxID=554083 RepID=A0A1R1LJE7_9MICC|nr:nucleobase:cation symporter-2 family protein [Tersicoccus phoenicis]OMH27657.1 uracil permease [Tersicoccus phoenicis]